MLKLIETDEVFTLAKQLEEEGGGPVILVAKFTVDPADADQLIAAWKGDAEYFLSQPGCISAQMHRGIAGSGVLMNYAVWESVQLFREAFTRPQVKAHRVAYPPSATAALHLFRKVAVPGVCLG